MQNLDDMRGEMCVAQLSLSNMRNVTEQDVPSSRNLRSTGIAKPVTGKFANTKPEDIQSGSSPFKRKYKHNNIQNIHYNACNLVSKQTEGSKSHLQESESISESPAKRRKGGWGRGVRGLV